MRYDESLVQSLLDVMESSTCVVDSSGEIVATNRAWRQAGSGASGSRLPVGGHYLDIWKPATRTDPDVAAQISEGLKRLLGGLPDQVTVDYPCTTGDNERWISLRMTPLHEIAGAVLSHVDISAAKLSARAMSYQSLHDPLTQLPNRDLLRDRLRQALAWAERTGRPVVVAFLSLDSFGRVNERLGHSAGDTLLQAISGRWLAMMRSGDTLARFAGDEFVAVWPGVESIDEGEALVRGLSAVMESPFTLNESTVAMSASIGVAISVPSQSSDDLLQAADAAMAEAKARGPGHITLHSDALRQGIHLRLRTEVELREALRHDELVLHYQPVVDLKRGVTTGVEALVRWRRADGLRMPDTFIPAAEASGLIVPLGAWVLQEACRQGAIWRRQGLDLDVAVNLSARQVTHPDIVGTIRAALRSSGLPPERLLVEVTESTVMVDADAAEVALQAIAALGVPVAIDDFGTGYSSLVYLKRYDLHALKVDRSFVAGMGVSAEDDAIVASIINLASAVGAVCIAEGVETSEQHAALVALGCDYAQGFLFGRPVPAEALAQGLIDCAGVLASLPPALT
ncbi:MAG TPA: EAL domain-containing protein [Actinomycetes bacterium]|jgi:diguanylate cyclase (GGDEF)-like protein